MRVPRPSSRVTLAGLAASLVLVIVGVIVVIAAGGSKSLKEQVKTGSASIPAVAFHLSGVRHGKGSIKKPVAMKVSNGTLTKVELHQAGGGTVPGAFNRTNTHWHTDRNIAPSSRITAKVTYADLAGHATTKSFKVRTKAAKQTFNDYLLPAGGVVGIGEPVMVNFDRWVPAKKRAAIESGLSVKTKPAVVGAWHWTSGQSVHWRPPHYWKPGTKVTVSSNLQGVSITKGTYGPVGTQHAKFKIGDSHISEANQATHQMKVYDNGKLIKTFPISTGRVEYPTMDGVHIALDKESVVTMDSATVGIPKGSPGYYNETVYWDVRISNGGEYVHAAPWSVGSQGFTNVSHGCVNISTENAEWFYNWSRLGDIVDVYDGVRPPEVGGGGTADWNMSWKDWLKGDAAPTKAAKALHPRMPHTYEPNFSPAAKAHAKAKAHKKAERKKAAHRKAEHKGQKSQHQHSAHHKHTAKHSTQQSTDAKNHHHHKKKPASY
jgi:lipoprotein-anchoring transpeptidase ErfK/SrfK